MSKEYKFDPIETMGVARLDMTHNFIGTPIAFQPGNRITGVVHTQGRVIPGVEVDGGSLGLRFTDDSGFFAFESLTTGAPFTLRVNPAGFRSYVKSGNVTANHHFTIGLGGTIAPPRPIVK